MNNLSQSFENIFDSIETNKMELSPSCWSEKHRTLTKAISTLSGKYKYDITPYLREIIDSLSPYHPAKIVAIMKGSQIGFTEGVLVNGICWMIANDPGNCLSLSKDDRLSEEMVTGRLDQAIQSCGIQHLIRPNVLRKRNSRTGDTSKSKEYAGGNIYFGGLNSVGKFSNQRTLTKAFLDDWDNAPISDKVEGNLFDILQHRFKTAKNIMKQYYISTPHTKPSNIEHVYLKGDQRKWHLPCPKCGSFIEIIWHKMRDNNPIGVYFEKDSAGKLIEDSVGYVCQECGGFFKEKHKYEMNLNGIWKPTAEPSEPGFYSYHITSLISPPHAFGWTDYARTWLDIFDEGTEKRSKLKVFLNQTLGQPWEERKVEISAQRLSRNTREYEIGVVPNLTSKEDGNGEIILITCACDLNGNIDDARLDYDVWGHAENGSTYSIDQGSIGTYQPKSDPDKRELMSYKHEVSNSVWDVFWNEVLNRDYYNEEGNTMRIFQGGIDTGYCTQLAYEFIDQFPNNVIGLKGDDFDRFSKVIKDVPTFKAARERPGLFILEHNLLKDELSEMVTAKWTEGNPQPAGFMNFPQPANGKYSKHYFKQFEAEEKTLEENEDGDPTGWKWTKKSGCQNHFWDCFDKETQILTKKGWKYLKDLDSKDIVGTVNLDNDSLEFQKPINLIKKQFKGKAISIETRKVSSLSTDTHNMIVYRKTYIAESGKYTTSNKPSIVKAKDLRITDKIKASCKWNKKGDCFIIIPELRDSMNRITANEKKIPSDVWAAFIGLFVSEGCKSKHYYDKRKSYSHRVSLFQKEGESLDKIEEIMKKMPFNYFKRKQSEDYYSLNVTQKQLYLALEDLGSINYKKRSGNWIKKQSKYTIGVFLEYAILGDGYVNKNCGHRKYYTTSKFLADDMQELIVRFGYQSTIGIVKPEKCSIRPESKPRTQYHVSENKVGQASLRKSDNTPLFKQVDYNDMVYCATVKNGTLVLRRNGKTFIAGNCAYYNLAVRDIMVQKILKAADIKKGGWADYVAIMKKVMG